MDIQDTAEFYNYNYDFKISYMSLCKYNIHVHACIRNDAALQLNEHNIHFIWAIVVHIKQLTHWLHDATMIFSLLSQC